jgi:hypothetical protein
MGLVFAAAGLCCGLSLPGPSEEPALTAGARAVGTSVPLRFTNPPVPGLANEFDLGDAAFGSFVTRYVTAEGGLRPYRFLSFGPQSFANLTEGFRTTLDFSISGLLAGSCPQALGFPPSFTTITGQPGFRFFVRVQDALGTGPRQADGFFNLAFVSTNVFRFAVPTKLPDARLGQSYLAAVAVVNGTPPYTFSIISIANADTGAAVKATDLGVFVAPDGVLSGRPLIAGNYQLQVRCQDVARRTALNRAATSQDEVFTLTVADNLVTSSELTTLQCSVRGSTQDTGHDSLRFVGFVNILGQGDTELANSDFSFRLGNIGFSGRLDRHGKFNAVLRNSQQVMGQVAVVVNAKKGTITVNIQSGVFTDAGARLDLLGFLAKAPAAGLTRLPVRVTIGDAMVDTEVIDFNTQVSGSRYALDYRLGMEGASDGGGFQIVSVQGKDGNTFSGQPGDAWRAKFLATPRLGVKDPNRLRQGFDNITAVTLRIGSVFEEKLTSANLRNNGTKVSFKGTSATGTRSFMLNTRKFSGEIQTNTLRTQLTGIPQATQALRSSAIFFPLGMDLVRPNAAPFTGENARRIFGLKNQYRDVLPPR